MKEKNPTLLLFPIEKARRFSPRFMFIGRSISKIIYSLKYDLQDAEINISPEKYSLASFISAIFYSFILFFTSIAFGMVVVKEVSIEVIGISILVSIIALVTMLIFHLSYPKIAAKQLAGRVEQDLMVAFRTMLIQLSSGMSLFETLKDISNSDYGQVSKEFDEVVKDIKTGGSETEALEKLAFKTKSDILKKAIWQMVSTLKSGGSLSTALNSEVGELIEQQENIIKKYSAELNLWTLVYLIIAAAMPSLGITFLVIASSIGGSGIKPETIMLIVILALIMEGAIIAMIKTRVPKVIK